MFDNDSVPEGFEELTPEQTAELLKALGVSEEEGAEIVGAMVGKGTAAELLPRLMDEAGPEQVVASLTSWAGMVALEHTLEGGCDCGAEAHFDEIFEKLTQAIEMAKEALRPLYLNTYEVKVFEREVEEDLSGIETISEDDLEALRWELAENEDEA